MDNPTHISAWCKQSDSEKGLFHLSGCKLQGDPGQAVSAVHCTDRPGHAHWCNVAWLSAKPMYPPSVLQFAKYF